MRYYVTADVHGFYSELIAALTDAGFFADTLPHKLIICGDVFDRGTEAVELQNFILDLMQKDEVILIKGNHEDLALNLLNNWHLKSYMQYHHNANGTVDTVCQLAGIDACDLHYRANEAGSAFLQSPYIQRIIPSMVDYYETGPYIFVHGWIPCTVIKNTDGSTRYAGIDAWRNADKAAWDSARWINGMEAAHNGIVESGKTIICGHWHCSFGHAKYENDGSEFENNANFRPYYANGIIAIDACTAVSSVVNCIVLVD